MTAADFHQLALGIPGATGSQHGGHPDFRIAGKVFASLGVPDEGCGMVKLSPEQQRAFIEQSPEVFQPFKGTWGERGYTRVDLGFARKEVLKAALQAAANTVSSPAAKKRPRKGK
jgi:hypothetical protein